MSSIKNIPLLLYSGQKKRPTIGRSWEVLAEVCGENAIKRKKGGIDRWNAS